MQLMSLTHLRVLHISSYCLDANLDDLRLNCASLEELHLYSDVDWKSNEYLRMDTQIKDSQRPKTDSNRVRLTKCLQKLRLILVWGVLTDRIVDLLRLELPALRIELRHLYYADMKTLPEVISMLAPRLKWLYFCGNILIGQLGNLFGDAAIRTGHTYSNVWNSSFLYFPPAKSPWASMHSLRKSDVVSSHTL